MLNQPRQAQPAPDFAKLAQFDQAWRSGARPRLDDYLPPGNDPARRELLAALIQIDLEYRWRETGEAARPRLEEYLARHPELGPAEALSVELIGEEYRVRQRFGDKPAYGEFSRRFPRQAPQLASLLSRIDAELAQEFVSAPAISSKSISPITSAAELVAVLRRFEILKPESLGEVEELARAARDARALASELLRRNWLTPYQLNQLLQGHGAELVVGPYVLIERLGEGGAGSVYKARHRTLGMQAALKVIRPDLLAEPEAVARFQREIELTSRLDHAHVIRAYNAGEAAGKLYLAMEYVEGCDLGRMVKEGGPLPPLQACEYIRQAALGLQHAHERGLVHRDIKPHNLIMSLREGCVKLADLGLGRFARPVNAEVTAVLSGQHSTGTLTPHDNAGIIGTVDYLAPEQAMNFHQADIRADIYSLGCTFYFLLTGQPPFANGNLAEKLARHMNQTPTPLQQVCNDLPGGLSAVVSKMLAKQPEERFQSPGELAAALAGITASGNSARRISRRWLIGLASAAALVLAVLGINSLSSSKKTALAEGKEGKPALIIDCGQGRRIGPGQGVIAGTTQEIHVASGYGCKLTNGYASDTLFKDTSRPNCWWDYWSLRFEVTVPPGTAGTLRLQFIDGDNKKRKQRLIVQDRLIDIVEDFPYPGKHVDVPITAADTASGKILVKIENAAGTSANSVVSTIEFTPAP
ncbi:MAG: serine/threonine-protein kinase [Gemmataceae bacterium]